jgi:hypothetical protein
MYFAGFWLISDTPTFSDITPMQNQDYLSVSILIISGVYYFYLLDPFRGKPMKRNYIKILNDPGFFILNLGIAIVISVTGVVRILQRDGDDGFSNVTMSPLFFIISVKAVNAYSRKYQGRDFFLHLRGDVVKSSSFTDNLGTVIVLVFSLFFGPIVLYCIQSK